MIAIPHCFYAQGFWGEGWLSQFGCPSGTILTHSPQSRLILEPRIRAIQWCQFCPFPASICPGNFDISLCLHSDFSSVYKNSVMYALRDIHGRLSKCGPLGMKMWVFRPANCCVDAIRLGLSAGRKIVSLHPNLAKLFGDVHPSCFDYGFNFPHGPCMAE